MLGMATPVPTLPGAWHYRASTGTGWPVSGYCDWMGQKVWAATSVSLWQHIQLPE